MTLFINAKFPRAKRKLGPFDPHNRWFLAEDLRYTLGPIRPVSTILYKPFDVLTINMFLNSINHVDARDYGSNTLII